MDARVRMTTIPASIYYEVLGAPEADAETPPRRELAVRRAVGYGSEVVRAGEAERADKLEALGTRTNRPDSVNSRK